MADDLSNRGPQDRTRINVPEAPEARYWAGKFAVSEAELRTVVAAVGVSAQSVAQHLGSPVSKFSS